ncbi:MAG: SBBP repeat-containing protein [Gammaproteobacteria bacterium]
MHLAIVFGLTMLLAACGGGSSGTTTLWTGTRQLGAAGATVNTGGDATDANGNVFITGDTDTGLDGNTLSGIRDFFVTKYDSGGTKRYTRELGVANADTYGADVATDSSGNVYVTGDTTGGLDGNTLAGTDDSFVSKYNSAGTKQYTRQLGVAGAATYGVAITADSSGNIYVAGCTTGGLDGNTLSGSGDTDFFVTKYDSSGAKQWTRQLGVVGANTCAEGIATDAGGNVYVAGMTTGGLDGNTLSGSGDIDLSLTKYDSSGNKQWTQQLGVAGANTEPRALAIDTNGNLYIAGWTTGGLDGNTLSGSGDADLFVTKYDSSGAKQWTRQLGVAASGTTGTYGEGAAIDGSGNVYVTGGTSGGLDGNTLTGTEDFFLVKYDSSGAKQWTRQLGVAGANTQASGAATDTGNNIFVAGWTKGGLDGNTLAGFQDMFITKYDSAGVNQ